MARSRVLLLAILLLCSLLTSGQVPAATRGAHGVPEDNKQLEAVPGHSLLLLFLLLLLLPLHLPLLLTSDQGPGATKDAHGVPETFPSDVLI